MRGVNSRGKGGWSNLVNVAVAGANTPPGQVSGLSATAGTYSDKVRLNWNSVPSASYYGVYRYDPAIKKITGAFRVSGSATSFDDTRAPRKGKKYGYLVAAFNKAGRGKWSNYAIGYKRAGSFRGVKIEPPKTVTGTLNSKKGVLALKWSKVKGASEYYIYRKVKGEKKFKWTKITVAGKLYHTVKIPSAGKLYMYSVRSKSAFGGESADSKPVAGFINKKRFVVRHRFMDDGFGRFKGKWTALDWDGESGPKKVILEMDKNGKSFVGAFKKGSENLNFKGSFAARSSVIEGDKFRMQLYEDGANEVIVNPDTIDELRLSFLRE